MSQAGLGLLGGTFDPVHCAHLRLGRAACSTLGLEQTLLIPAAEPPLKPRCVASAEHRVQMVRLAVQDEDGLEVCTIELERPGPSYTVDTLALLRQRHPDRALWFIAGSDTLASLDAWKRAEELFELAHFAVVVRSAGPEPRRLEELLPPQLAAPFRRGPNGWVHASGTELRLLPFEPLGIASSTIRARLRAGQPVEGWVPEPVLAYIHSHGLYQEDS